MKRAMRMAFKLSREPSEIEECFMIYDWMLSDWCQKGVKEQWEPVIGRR
jgi:hypothetical protein